jgi:hypothetical protein
MTELVRGCLRSVNEVAVYLHLSEQSVYRRIRSWWREETTVSIHDSKLKHTGSSGYTMPDLFVCPQSATCAAFLKAKAVEVDETTAVLRRPSRNGRARDQD